MSKFKFHSSELPTEPQAKLLTIFATMAGKEVDRDESRKRSVWGLSRREFDSLRCLVEKMEHAGERANGL